jgi:hypothetical protein
MAFHRPLAHSSLRIKRRSADFFGHEKEQEFCELLQCDIWCTNSGHLTHFQHKENSSIQDRSENILISSYKISTLEYKKKPKETEYWYTSGN